MLIKFQQTLKSVFPYSSINFVPCSPLHEMSSLDRVFRISLFTAPLFTGFISVDNMAGCRSSTCKTVYPLSIVFLVRKFPSGSDICRRDRTLCSAVSTPPSVFLALSGSAAAAGWRSASVAELSRGGITRTRVSKRGGRGREQTVVVVARGSCVQQLPPPSTRI